MFLSGIRPTHGREPHKGVAGIDFCRTRPKLCAWKINRLSQTLRHHTMSGSAWRMLLVLSPLARVLRTRQGAIRTTKIPRNGSLTGAGGAMRWRDEGEVLGVQSLQIAERLPET